jgi:putative heme-binding domain-containing protein
VGIITSETAAELTLRTMGGISQQYAKAEITARRPLPNSLMPAGLERAMTEQELINLVEYMAALGR